MIEKDGIRVTSLVGVPPDEAFRIFTEEIDLWWRRGPRFRAADARLHFEPGEGGRLVETDGDGEEFEIGRVLQWVPGESLIFEWRNKNFVRNEVTRVEIRFEPSKSGTKISLEHSGWDVLDPDHPARHGLDDRGLTRLIGLWWVDLLDALRKRSSHSM